MFVIKRLDKGEWYSGGGAWTSDRMLAGEYTQEQAVYVAAGLTDAVILSAGTSSLAAVAENYLIRRREIARMDAEAAALAARQVDAAKAHAEDGERIARLIFTSTGTKPADRDAQGRNVEVLARIRGTCFKAVCWFDRDNRGQHWSLTVIEMTELE